MDKYAGPLSHNQTFLIGYNRETETNIVHWPARHQTVLFNIGELSNGQPLVSRAEKYIKEMERVLSVEFITK